MSETPAIPLAEALRDRYVIERALGQGGMATVWLARDLKHDRPVALKVLRPELSAIVGAERFLREIRLTARLQHPHILTLIDSGEAAGLLFYVLPFVEGESLRSRLLREGQLPVADALRVTRDVAAALDYAHGQGVIHRDIKPENILLHQGEAVVADFGIALAVSTAGRERLTETGLSLGTPAYMSPEQATASPRLDGRSDQYSLACVLYEMLAGEPPYTGPTAQAIIAKRLSEPVPHLRTVREVPPAVDAAVRRALSRAPADRFASVGQFVAGTERESLRRSSTRRAGLVGAGAAVGLLAVLGFLLRAPRVSYRPMTQRQFTFTGNAAWPALSPDGRSVAYVSRARSLVVQSLDGGEPLVLVPPARYLDPPHWTKDGSTILFAMFRDSTELAATYAISSRGGSARKVLEDIAPFDPGPDSSTLVRAPRLKPRLEFVEWRTGKQIRTVPLPDTIGEVTEVEWSPDIPLIAFTAGGAVWTIPVAGGNPQRVAEGRNVRWSPGSPGLYFLTGDAGAVTLQRIAVDRATGAARGEARHVASLPTTRDFDVGGGGRLVHAQASQSAQARALVFDGAVPRRIVEDRLLTEGTGEVTSVGISRDGATVTYGLAVAGNEDLYQVPFAGGVTSPMIASRGRDTRPRWSPTGSRLAFLHEEQAEVAAMLLEETGATQRLGSEAVGSYYDELVSPAWSGDGRFIAYFGREARRVVVVDLNNQRDRVVEIPDSIGTGYLGLALSPGGDRLLLSTIRRVTDWGELWMARLGDQSWSRVSGPFGESLPLDWRADGWIYLLSHRALFGDQGVIRVEVWRMRGPDGVPELFARLPDGCPYWALSLSADANRAVCGSVRVTSDLFVGSDFDTGTR